ncbi:MAG: TetR/AcrR family transcriptional regulator [Candidatus Cloacimonetes bacterium]|nr:TetR/AcrR family transcriptional regulator [Candidatus Cloacimonadota bacterium]
MKDDDKSMENQKTEELQPEERILQAAIEEFISRGYEGTRMQGIADRAGISKSALHYYFRLKERLFRAVLDATVGKTIAKLRFEISETENFREKLEVGLRQYYRAITKNVKIVRFLFMEVSRNPGMIDEFLEKGQYRLWLDSMNFELQREYESGRINQITAENLILNLVSMSIFPQLGAPIIRKILNRSESEYAQLIAEREEVILQFIMQAVLREN